MKAEKKAGFKEKVSKFIEKHGYTVKAFVLCLIVLPPAAVIIPIKHPTWTGPQKSLAVATRAIFIVVMFSMGTALTAALVGGIYKLIALISGG
ncbi:MAG: hypothetical protein HKP58_02280 [Desulfatitalea sp.]|nr:hypothetical protein [Desulfatitalea sp.]NNJ99216.1 hypothetical protein [Desulfatitalea sp.]